MDRVIPATEWVFHPYPIILTGLAIVYGSMMLWMLAPPDQNCAASSGSSISVTLTPVDGGAAAAAAVHEPGRRTTPEAPSEGPRAHSPATGSTTPRCSAGSLAVTGSCSSVRAFVTQGWVR